MAGERFMCPPLPKNGGWTVYVPTTAKVFGKLLAAWCYLINKKAFIAVEAKRLWRDYVDFELIKIVISLPKPHPKEEENSI